MIAHRVQIVPANQVKPGDQIRATTAPYSSAWLHVERVAKIDAFTIEISVFMSIADGVPVDSVSIPIDYEKPVMIARKRSLST